MANESAVEQQQERDFFQFSGRYHVSSDTSAEEMASDATCFLDSAEAMVNKLIDDFNSEVSPEDQALIFGIRHFVTMAKNLCCEVQADLERSRHDASSGVHS